MTPLSAKTWGEEGEGRRGNEEIRVRRGKRWGREDERDERRSGVIVRRREEREEGEGKMTGEKKRVVVPAVDLSTLDARIAALKQYTVYPWAIDRVQALPRLVVVVRGWRSEKTVEERARGRKRRENTRVEFAPRTLEERNPTNRSHSFLVWFSSSSFDTCSGKD